MPLQPFPPERHNIMSGQNTDTRTHHNRGHVLTRNSITFIQSTSAFSKIRSLCWDLWDDDRILLRRVDQSPRNTAFLCLIAMIHNVDCEITVVNPIKHLCVLLFPTWTELVL